MTSGLLLALITGAPAGSLLGSALGWHATFAVLAAAGLAMFVVTACTTRRRPPSPAGPAPGDHQASGSPQSAWPRLRAVSVTTLWALAVYGVYTYLGTIIASYLHASAATVAAALAVMAAALHGGVAPVLPALALLGLAAYPFFTAQQTRLATVFPAASGSILAWNNSAMYAGILAGSALGGLLLHASSPTVLVLAAMLVALLVCLIAASSLIIRSDGGFRPAVSRAAYRRDGR